MGQKSFISLISCIYFMYPFPPELRSYKYEEDFKRETPVIFSLFQSTDSQLTSLALRMVMTHLVHLSGLILDEQVQ